MSRFSLFSLSVAIAAIMLQQATIARADEEKVKALLEQRRDVLRQVVQLHEATYRLGKGTMVELISAKRELVEAELELCEMADERIELRKAVVKFAKDYETATKRQHALGDAPQIDVLRATEMRLAAEVELHREVTRAR